MRRERLLGFLVLGVFLADRAILVKFKTIGIVALVLKAVVVSVFAFRTLKRNLHSRRFRSHAVTPYKKITPLSRCIHEV